MDTTRGRARIVVMGAAGRDFHDFNVVYRGNLEVEVIAFNAAQIPGISGRRYPPELAGPDYPEGIPIVDETGLVDLCHRESIDQVVFAFSDVTHGEVMRAASRSMSTGTDFVLLGPSEQFVDGEPSRYRRVRGAHRVREETERWVEEYNTLRPHESLGDNSPIEFLNDRGHADLSTYGRI